MFVNGSGSLSTLSNSLWTAAGSTSSTTSFASSSPSSLRLYSSACICHSFMNVISSGSISHNYRWFHVCVCFRGNVCLMFTFALLQVLSRGLMRIPIAMIASRILANSVLHFVPFMAAPMTSFGVSATYWGMFPSLDFEETVTVTGGRLGLGAQVPVQKFLWPIVYSHGQLRLGRPCCCWS